MPKRVYQPKKTKRIRTHGFRLRMKTLGGRNVLKHRRLVGRRRLSNMPQFIFRQTHKTGASRFVIVISKKIDKRATKRNRMRRLIRECLRRLVPTGFLITCVVKTTIADWSYKDVEKNIKEALYEKTHT